MHQAAAQADLALVLAVDVSGSVSGERFHLQREGIAKALDSDDFANVVSAGNYRPIEIAVVEWAEEQSVIVPVTVVRGRQHRSQGARTVCSAQLPWGHPRAARIW